MNIWYRISLICGLTPLVIGILIFFSWLIARAHWLEAAGIINIYVGLVIFTIGMIALIIYIYKARKNSLDGYWKKSILPFAILIINFPFAAGVIVTVFYVLSFSTVIIENQSSTEIENIFLSERGHIYEFGSVMPNEVIEKKFRFKSEGSINYSYKRNGIKYEGIMIGYVTSEMGESASMVISESGEVNINEKI